MNTAIEVFWEADYKISSIKEVPKANKTFWDNQIQYSQKIIAPSWCVFFSWLWCITDITGHIFSDKDFEWVKRLAPTYWRDEDNWMYVYKWCDLVRHYRNDVLWKDNVASFNIVLWENDFYKVLDLWYSVHTGYRGNKEYSDDAWRDWDCVLMANDIWQSTYGHAIRIVKKWDEYYVIDNYKWRKCNIYKLNDLKWLIKNNVFFNSWYIYIPKQEIEMTENIILPEHLEANKQDSESREIILAWEKVASEFLQKWNKLRFNNYKDKFTITKMLIDIANMRI